MTPLTRRLVVVRHGNTFRPGETPTRVGGRTDLPLVEEARARAAARVLRDLALLPDQVFAAPLKRTRQTAGIILDELALPLPIQDAPAFREIDYGPDENRTEDEVRRRLGRHYLALESPAPLHDDDDERIPARGEEAIRLWNAEALVPHGWLVDVPALVADWKAFASDIAPGETRLLVSSNGVIRFAPSLLGPEQHKRFTARHTLKVATAATCVFVCQDGVWDCTHWNVKPEV